MRSKINDNRNQEIENVNQRAGPFEKDTSGQLANEKAPGCRRRCDLHFQTFNPPTKKGMGLEQTQNGEMRGEDEPGGTSE